MVSSMNLIVAAVTLYYYINIGFAFQPIAHKTAIVSNLNGNAFRNPPGLFGRPKRLPAVTVLTINRKDDVAEGNVLIWKSRFRTLTAWFRSFQKRASKLMVTALLLVLCYTNTAWAVSGGRVGGSFDAAPRSSPSRPSYSAPRSSFSRPSRPFVLSLPRTRYYSSPRIYSSPRVRLDNEFEYTRIVQPTTLTSRFPSASEIAFITGAGVLIGMSLRDKSRDGDEGTISPLGKGATFASLTVQMNVPEREDPSSILNKLKRLTNVCDTTRRKGVQDLLSEGNDFSIISFLLQQKLTSRNSSIPIDSHSII